MEEEVEQQLRPRQLMFDSLTDPHDGFYVDLSNQRLPRRSCSPRRQSRWEKNVEALQGYYKAIK